MIDTTLLGQQAARCMESLEEHDAMDGGKLVAVGIIVAAENAEGDMTITRTFCSDTTYYRQLGLFEAGLDCLKSGYRYGTPEELGEDEPGE